MVCLSLWNVPYLPSFLESNWLFQALSQVTNLLFREAKADSSITQPGLISVVLSNFRSSQIYYMYGFLFLVFIILIITCSETTILLCYFHLCAEVRPLCSLFRTRILKGSWTFKLWIHFPISLKMFSWRLFDFAFQLLVAAFRDDVQMSFQLAAVMSGG